MTGSTVSDLAEETWAADGVDAPGPLLPLTIMHPTTLWNIQVIRDSVGSAANGCSMGATPAEVQGACSGSRTGPLLRVLV